MTDTVYFVNKDDTTPVKLTMTSANHVANLAKELYKVDETILQNLRFFHTDVSLIGFTETSRISTGTEQEVFNNISTYIKEIVDCKALIAWLREAIKARTQLISETENKTLEDYCKEQEISLPEAPVKGHILTEDEYYESLSVKERNAYYSLEATCATLGKLIHPGGNYSVQKDLLHKIKIAPTDIKGEGRDAMIYKHTPCIDEKAVEDKFFVLQKEYREAQAQLNSIKFSCQKAIEESKAAAHILFQNEYNAYQNKILQLRNELAVYVDKKIKDIGNLRIIIPNSLMPIYQRVNTVATDN